MIKFTSLVITTLLVLVAGATAQMPSTLPLQGQLFQSDGSPLPDGTYEVTVRIHTNPDSAGTVMCDACQVPFVDGVFQVVLGRDGMPELPSFEQALWVSLTVNGEELSPKIELHPVAYAHEAAHVAQQRSSGVPVGTVIALAGPPAPDSDYMIADGRALLSSNYPALFEAIGRLWGDGSNAATDDKDFNIPDLRGIYIRGDDLGTGRDANFNDRAFARDTKGDSSTVGSYHGIDKFPISEEFGPSVGGGKVRRPNLLLTERDYAFETYADRMTATPNAAMIYVIKWR